MGIRYEAPELVSMRGNGHFTTMATSEYEPLGKDTLHESTKANVAASHQHVPRSTAPAWKHSQGSHRFTIEPFFPVVQTAPARWLDPFAVLLDDGMPPAKVNGVYQKVQRLDCTDTFWLDAERCGNEGVNCQSPDVTMAFHCPANCARVKVQKQHFVGAQDIIGQSPVIGGPLYRADSSICASSIHADIIRDSVGGCGILSVGGQANSFPGSASNGIESINLESYFPQTFKFQYDGAFPCQVPNTRRWLLPYASIALTMLVFGFTTSSTVPVLLTFVVGFVHIASISESVDATQRLRRLQAVSTPGSPPLLTLVLTKFLPALICTSFVYRRSVRQTFHKLTAQLEKAFFWLGAFWIGAFSNQTFEWIPSLTLSTLDFETRHLLLTKFLLIIITLHQIYYLRSENRLSKSIPLYTAYGLALLVLTILPDLYKFIYFYILALLLLPGSGTQTRASLFYQGLLLGLFIHGIARNGFAPAIPSQSISHVDATQLSSLPPVEILEDPIIWRGFGGSNITFTWKTPVPAEVDGISFLLNDVERERRYFDDKAGDNTFKWARSPQAVPDYIRFSWIKDGKAIGYGDAGVWKPHGEWSGLGNA